MNHSQPPSPSVIPVDTAKEVEQAIRDLESWVIDIIHREPHVDVSLALHIPIQKLIAAVSASYEDEIARLTEERDAARKGLFHRLTGWDKDGQTPDQILDELQQLRNTVALLSSSTEVAALREGLKDAEAGRVKSLTEIDAIASAERARGSQRHA